MKKNETNLEVMEVDAEEIPLEEEIQSSLVKSNITESLFLELEERYSKLPALKTLDDKETYLMLKESRKNIRVVGIALEKICKKGREKAIQIQKAWLKKEKDLSNRLDALLLPVDSEIKKFDDEVERKENEEKERKEKVFQERQSTLIKYGAQYNNGSFELNHISYQIDNIKEADDEIWESIILPKFYAEFEKLEAEKVRIEKDREAAALKLKQEQDELNRQREEMERQKKELAEAQAAMQKMKDDAERERKLAAQKKLDEEMRQLVIRNTQRGSKLREMGMELNKNFDYVFSDITVSYDLDVKSLTNEEWDALINKITPTIEERKKAIEAKKVADAEEQNKLQRQRIVGKARFDSLVEIGINTENAINLGCLSDNDWNTMFSAYKAQYDKKKQEEWLADLKFKKELEEQEKAEELAQAKDKDKWQLFIENIQKLETFDMRSGQYRKRMQIAKEKLSEIIEL